MPMKSVLATLLYIVGDLPDYFHLWLLEREHVNFNLHLIGAEVALF